jgi:hypothetical protein
MNIIKRYSFIVLALMPSLSWAFPAVGDFVQYQAIYKDAPVIMEKRVLAHDMDLNTFTVSLLTTYKDIVLQDQTNELPKGFLYTPEKIKRVLETCVAREGAVGNMTVAGIKMQVCEFYNEDSQLTDILGPVPFGQIRFQVYLEGEEFLDFNLTQFSMGTELKKAPGTF